MHDNVAPELTVILLKCEVQSNLRGQDENLLLCKGRELETCPDMYHERHGGMYGKGIKMATVTVTVQST